MMKMASKMITAAEVTGAQEKWAHAIVDIGHAYTTGADAVECASAHVQALYAYDDNVLFKPTKCAQRPFRLTREGAISYFVGNRLAQAGFTEDEGFAMAPFMDVRFVNMGIITEMGRAVAMGNYYFTKADGQVIKAEYTFCYRPGNHGLVIDVHHSSLPYSRKKSS